MHSFNENTILTIKKQQKHKKQKLKSNSNNLKNNNNIKNKIKKQTPKIKKKNKSNVNCPFHLTFHDMFCTAILLQHPPLSVSLIIVHPTHNYHIWSLLHYHAVLISLYIISFMTEVSIMWKPGH